MSNVTPKEVMSKVIMSCLKDLNLECSSGDIEISSDNNVCKAILKCGDYTIERDIEKSYNSKMKLLSEKQKDLDYSSHSYMNAGVYMLNLSLQINESESSAIRKAIHDLIYVFTDGFELDNNEVFSFLRHIEIHKQGQIAKVKAIYNSTSEDGVTVYRPGFFYCEYNMSTEKVLLRNCKMYNLISNDVLWSDYADLFMENAGSGYSDEWNNNPSESKYIGYLVTDWKLGSALSILLKDRNDLNITIYNEDYSFKDSLKYTLGVITLYEVKPMDLVVQQKDSNIIVGVPKAFMLEWNHLSTFADGDFTPAAIAEINKKFGLNATTPDEAYYQVRKKCEFVCVDSIWNDRVRKS